MRASLAKFTKSEADSLPPVRTRTADIASLLMEDDIVADTPLCALQRLSLQIEMFSGYTPSALAEQKREFNDLTIPAFPDCG